MSKSTLGAVAGATIGFVVGGPTGAKIGWTLGSFLFSEPGPNTEGPRLDSLSVESLDYGSPIPIGYGRFRVSGFRFWQRDIREQAHTETQGKGGGGGATNTTYTYYGTWAVALTGNELIGVRKIWFDAVLFYDASDSASTETIIASNRAAEYFTFYPGSSTQDADSLIQATQGAANTPAYRHTSHIVFDDVPLEKYGNRIPNVTVECVESGARAESMPWTVQTGVDRLWQSVAWSPKLNLFVAVGNEGGNANYVMTSNNGEVWSSYACPAFTWSDIIWVDELEIFVSVSSSSNQYNVMTSNNGIDWTSVLGVDNVAFSSVAWSPELHLLVAVALSGSASTWVMTSVDGVTWRPANAAVNIQWTSVAWSSDLGLFCAVAKTGVGNRVMTSADGINWTSRVSADDSNWLSVAWSSDIGIFVAVGISGNVMTSPDGIVWTLRTAISGSWSEVRWIPELSIFVSVAYSGSAGRAMTSADGITWAAYPAINGSEWRAFDYSPALGILASVSSAGTDIVMTSPGTAYGVVPATKLLSAIQTDICERAGLTASDIVVTELTDSVDGYIITSNMSARAASEPLMKAFFYDGAEFGNKINFVKRGESSIKTIPQDDLGAAPYGSDQYALKQTRMQNSELPSDVSIGYISAVRDYEIATQRAQRINYSVPNSIGQELAIVMSDDKALQIAEVGLYNAYVEREKFNFTLTNEHIDLNPTDVVTVVADSDSRIVRLVKLSYGDVIECESVSEDSQVYTSTATAAADSYTGQSIGLAGPTRVEYMDIPILRNADNDSGMYFACAGYYASWAGAQIFKSLDEGVTYNPVDSTFTIATIGSSTTVLADAVSTLWDRTNTLTVSLVAGTLSSATEANVIRGSNYLLVGSEIIQFANATLNADGTYTLDTLLRGRRGTEWATSGHAIGDSVVLLTEATLGRFEAVINTERAYKAVTIGEYVEGATKTNKTNTGVSLKPFSPAYVKGSRDGSNNITLTWMRRSRYIGAPLGTRPLFEDSESYEVDIMSGATVLRTISASSETASYTAAQQTTDGLTPGDPVTINVYQLSATAGRGYGTEATI